MWPQSKNPRRDLIDHGRDCTTIQTIPSEPRLPRALTDAGSVPPVVPSAIAPPGPDVRSRPGYGRERLIAGGGVGGHGRKWRERLVTDDHRTGEKDKHEGETAHFAYPEEDCGIMTLSRERTQQAAGSGCSGSSTGVRP